jgi:hypothetical protein
MYSFDVSLLTSTNTIEWEPIDTANKPTTGLMNYGMQITKSGKLIIFGGYTGEISTCSYTERKVKNVHDVLLLNLNAKVPNFLSLDWIDTEGGFSRIISLGEEMVCVLNPFLKTQMVVINLEKMISYDVTSSGFPQSFIKTGFGVVGSGANFIIYGGFDLSDGFIKDISQSQILVKLTFLTSSVHSSSESSQTTTSSIGVSSEQNSSITVVAGAASAAGFIIIVFLIIFLKRKNKKSTVTRTNEVF